MITSIPDDMQQVTEVTFTQLVSASGLTEAELTELVRYGALSPRDPGAAPWTFEARWIFTARKASRLRRELDLDPHGVSIVMSFLERIEGLEAELRSLRARAG
ncbi:MAG: chaperone modulator CbpM [Burkholderiaceae bacterium]